MTIVPKFDVKQRSTLGGRRAALIQIAGLAATAVAPGIVVAKNGRKYRMKIAISIPESHPTSQALKNACTEIASESGGRLIIDVYPNGQLGSDTDTVSQVRSGAIDFVCTAGMIWGNLVPVTSVNTVAFAFDDYATVWKAMDGDLGAHVRTAFDSINLVAVGKMYDHGFRHVTHSSKPILVPKDLEGMKIRVPASRMLTDLFRGLGASPATVPFGELYTALQTKVVDGHENSMPLIDTGKVYEVQEYCSYTSHVWDYFALVGNKRSWNALPEDLRVLATSVFDKHALEQRAAHEALNQSLEAKLTDAGMQFNQVDGRPFREALQKSGYYTEWKKRFGNEAWAVLEQYSGSLT